MIASLPMYDWPEVRAAQNAFWAHLRDGLRARGIDAPDSLSPETHWRDPALVFSQTCGWPWAMAYSDALDLVATPIHPLPGCGEGTYSSMVVVHADASAQTLADLRGKSIAYNGLDSQSGVHTLREAVAPLTETAPFFARGIESGAHRNSVKAVAQGDADCAAIDAVCWAMAQEHEPQATARLRVIHVTAPAPALPFVTRKGGPVVEIRAALDQTLAAGLGEPLHIRALVDPDETNYRALITRVANAQPLFRAIAR